MISCCPIPRLCRTTQATTMEHELVTLYKTYQKRCLRREMNKVHLVFFFIYLFTNHIMIKYMYHSSVKYTNLVFNK